MKSRSLCFGLAIGTGLISLHVPHAYAWSDHGLGTWLALKAVPELNPAAKVRAETFEDFVAAEPEAIAAMLIVEETWARVNVVSYPALPDSLRFHTGAGPLKLHDRLLRALRLNPTVPLPLFLQQIPGVSYDSSPEMDPREALIPLFVSGGHRPTLAIEKFLKLQPGQAVAALDVVVSAADEPDFGMDIGLWKDNGTPFGAEYGFSKQPFGAAHVLFSSQAPFHMGFFHEPGVIYAFRKSLKNTYPEMRIHQFTSLARLAFETGHAYWGWRLIGWALHYVQDLTQPYHTTPLPGTNTRTILFAAIRDLVGIHGPVTRIVRLATNRHFTLEKFQFESVREALEQQDPNNRYSSAMRDMRADATYPAFDDTYVRQVITKEACSVGKPVKSVMLRAFPKHWVNDSTHDWDEDAMDRVSSLEEITKNPVAKEAMEAMLEGLLRKMGSHSRNYVNSALKVPRP